MPASDHLRISDIGGHPVRGGGWFRRGVLFRISGGLLGPAELAHLDSIGLRAVVDLRGGDEHRGPLRDWATAGGVIYHHQPIALGRPTDLAATLLEHALTEEGGRAFLELTYRRIIEDFGPAIARAVMVLAEWQPAGFGCAAGKDRTGLVAALVQELLGVNRDVILREYVEQAPDPERLREAISRSGDFAGGALDGPGIVAVLSALEDVMAETLQFVDERYGGARRYLEGAGLTAETVDVLRDRLVGDPPEPFQPSEVLAPTDQV